MEYVDVKAKLSETGKGKWIASEVRRMPTDERAGYPQGFNTNAMNQNCFKRGVVYVAVPIT